MIRLLRTRIAFGLLLAFLALAAWAQVAVPDLTRRVTDLTATLSADQVAALESKLAAFEAQKGSQIAVLILPTTQPEDIAQFGIRVAEQWKIGRAKVDDGVILIVAKDDRTLRFEVGYGLEVVIPDAIAKRVIAETITPYFRAGDFPGGTDAGVTQLMQLDEGEPLPAPRQSEPDCIVICVPTPLTEKMEPDLQYREDDRGHSPESEERSTDYFGEYHLSRHHGRVGTSPIGIQWFEGRERFLPRFFPGKRRPWEQRIYNPSNSQGRGRCDPLLPKSGHNPV